MAKYLRILADVLGNSGYFEPIKGIIPKKVGEGRVLPNDLLEYGHSNQFVYEQFSLVRFLARQKPTYFLFPYNTAPIIKVNGVKYITVVHDLIFLSPLKWAIVPKSFWQLLGLFYRRWVVPLSIYNADHIIAISETTKKNIVQRFKIAENKITVIPNVSPIGFTTFDTNIACKKRNQLFCVAGDSPHKNVPFLIRAYSRLPTEIKTAYPLKIAGLRHSNNLKKIHGLIKDLRSEFFITILPLLTNEAIQHNYHESEYFIFPSTVEGFGIPLLEAMGANCKILCSNIDVFKEICGDAVVYFDAFDESSLLAALLATLSNGACNQVPITNYASILDRYSFRSFNDKILTFFNGLV